MIPKNICEAITDFKRLLDRLHFRQLCFARGIPPIDVYDLSIPRISMYHSQNRQQDFTSFWSKIRCMSNNWLCLCWTSWLSIDLRCSLSWNEPCNCEGPAIDSKKNNANHTAKVFSAFSLCTSASLCLCSTLLRTLASFVSLRVAFDTARSASAVSYVIALQVTSLLKKQIEKI